METTQTHTHNNDIKGFYTFIGIIAFSIIVLQPLAMMAVMFITALMQG